MRGALNHNFLYGAAFTLHFLLRDSFSVGSEVGVNVRPLQVRFMHFNHKGALSPHAELWETVQEPFFVGVAWTAHDISLLITPVYTLVMLITWREAQTHIAVPQRLFYLFIYFLLTSVFLSARLSSRADGVLDVIKGQSEDILRIQWALLCSYVIHQVTHGDSNFTWRRRL